MSRTLLIAVSIFVSSSFTVAQDLTQDKSPPQVISAKAKNGELFGEMQIALFKNDRPDTAELLNRNPAVQEWLSAAFSGKETGNRIHWDEKPPIGGPAQVFLQTAYSPSNIRISADPNMPSGDRVYYLIYSHCTILDQPRQTSLAREAIVRSMSEDEFVDKSLAILRGTFDRCNQVLIKLDFADESPAAKLFFEEDGDSIEESLGFHESSYQLYYRTYLQSFIERTDTE